MINIIKEKEILRSDIYAETLQSKEKRQMRNEDAETKKKRKRK